MSVSPQGVPDVPETLQVLLRSIARDAVRRGERVGRLHMLEWRQRGGEVRSRGERLGRKVG